MRSYTATVYGVWMRCDTIVNLTPVSPHRAPPLGILLEGGLHLGERLIVDSQRLSDLIRCHNAGRHDMDAVVR